MDATNDQRREDGSREALRWHDASRDPRAADILTAGVDVGSVSSQAVVCVDGRPYAWASLPAGSNSRDSARAAMARALSDTGLGVEEVHFVVGTGYGRANVPFAHKRISEIHCHARGANFMFGEGVRTVLDVGGQDYKAIRCDARGKVQAFLANDKCAAGTGRGMEIFADLLQVPLADVGPLSLAVAEEPAPVSSTCVVFAKSEAMALLRSGRSVEEVLAAYCAATSERVLALLEQVGVERGFGITGGIAKNSGVVTRLERALGFETMTSDWDPQLAGALGGALIGVALEQKRRRKCASRSARGGEERHRV